MNPDTENRLAMLDALMRTALASVNPERTARMLASSLEASMAEVPTSIRLPEDLMARLDALADRITRDPHAAALAGGTVSRAAVIRLALLHGVDALEAKYPRARR